MKDEGPLRGVKSEKGRALQGDDYAVAVPGDEPDMLQARAAARATLDQFINRLNGPVAGQEYVAVEVKLETKGTDEYVWVKVRAFENGSFIPVKGELQSSAKVPAEYSAEIPAALVLDWMIVEDGKLAGGYSLRTMRSKMSPGQRTKFDETLWFKME